MSGNDQHQYKDRYMLRLPDGMRDRIKGAAEANGRSMNAEIVAALEEKYPAPAPEAEVLARAEAAAEHLERSDDPQAQEAAELMRFLIESQGKRTAAMALAAYAATVKKGEK